MASPIPSHGPRSNNWSGIYRDATDRLEHIICDRLSCEPGFGVAANLEGFAFRLFLEKALRKKALEKSLKVGGLGFAN
jgi:hypothetical protein